MYVYTKTAEVRGSQLHITSIGLCEVRDNGKTKSLSITGFIQLLAPLQSPELCFGIGDTRTVIFHQQDPAVVLGNGHPNAGLSPFTGIVQQVAEQFRHVALVLGHYQFWILRDADLKFSGVNLVQAVYQLGQIAGRDKRFQIGGGPGKSC